MRAAGVSHADHGPRRTRASWRSSVHADTTGPSAHQAHSQDRPAQPRRVGDPDSLAWARSSRCVASTRPGNATNLQSCTSSSSTASGAAANTTPHHETACQMTWHLALPTCRQTFAVPRIRSRSWRPCWQTPATRCPRTRYRQRCAQGPRPETRSTVMCVIYPGGGLSMGGKRTSGPR